MPERLDDSTLSVDSPVWTGHYFEDRDAQAFWLMLPQDLQSIARWELMNGNRPQSILDNQTRGIVLLAFECAPTTPTPDTSSIRIHRQHAYGNYCYEGRLCTYEHLESGCFLLLTIRSIAMKVEQRVVA
jgi:hypothetical protein